MLSRDIMASSMKIARNMVGINELAMVTEQATFVFDRHGGRYDKDLAPVLGPCLNCHPNSAQPCSLQRLALGQLLLLSTFQTQVEVIAQKVLEQMASDIASAQS